LGRARGVRRSPRAHRLGGDPIAGLGNVAKYFPGGLNVDVGNIRFNLLWYPEAASAHDQPGSAQDRTVIAAKAAIARLP